MTPHPVEAVEVMALVDSEISPDRFDYVSTHVSSCADCRGVAQRLEDSRRTFATWRVEDMSPASAERIRSRLAGTDTKRTGWTENQIRELKQWSFGLVLGSAALVLILLFSTATPNLLRSRVAANEASAVGSLRTLNTAATAYLQRYGHYPFSLENFGPPRAGAPTEAAADLIDSVLAGGNKSGYLFRYRRVADPDSRGGYLIHADPMGPAGFRHFSTDQSGVIRMDGKVLDVGAAAKGNDGAAKNDEDVSHQLEPMIARSAELRLVVDRLDEARSSVTKVLAKHKGYVAQLSVNSQTDSGHSLVASLRVPSDELSPFLGELKQLGRLISESQSGEEVTKQHVDLVARLKNARGTEERINTVIQHRTGNVKEVLEAENEAARVRGEIERMEAERKTLETRVSLATIALSLSEEYKAQLQMPAPTATTRLRNALVGGLSEAWESGLRLLVWAVSVAPTLVLWSALLFFPVRWGWRQVTAIVRA